MGKYNILVLIIEGVILLAAQGANMAGNHYSNLAIENALAQNRDLAYSIWMQNGVLADLVQEQQINSEDERISLMLYIINSTFYSSLDYESNVRHYKHWSDIFNYTSYFLILAAFLLYLFIIHKIIITKSRKLRSVK